MRRDDDQPAGPRDSGPRDPGTRDRGRRRAELPFDAVHTDRTDVTEQFWGRTEAWAPRRNGAAAVDAHDATDRSGPSGEHMGSMRAIRDGFAAFRPRRIEGSPRSTGDFERTRSHGIVRPDTTHVSDHGDRVNDHGDHPSAGPRARIRRAEPSLAELAGGRTGANELDWDDDWVLPATTNQLAVVRHLDRPPPEPARDRSRAVPARSTRTHDRTHHATHHASADVYGDDVYGDTDDDADLIPLSPVAPLAQRLGLGAVDPLLRRLGVMILATAIAVPVAFASRGDDSGSLASPVSAVTAGAAGSADPAAAEAPTTATDATATGAAADEAATDQARDGAADQAVSAAIPVDTEPSGAITAPPTTDVGGGDDSASAPTSAPATTATDEFAVATEAAERIEPECALVYTAGPGDSWYRIADGAGITPNELLAANLADLDAPIFPGDEICLPAGAVMPAAPSTTPPTTAAPTTTNAPTTTAAPTTTTVAPAAPASTTEVQALIREIWLDELEERALEIAWRESGYRATAYNGHCCWGVFQIHWTAHRSWLGELGIDSASDLLDARKNITAAYTLYQRSGGWGPWGF